MMPIRICSAIAASSPRWCARGRPPCRQVSPGRPPLPGQEWK
jgi:hypothetical protein